MEPSLLTALAALSGSAIGGAGSFFGTWLGQSAQFKARLLLNDKDGRRELYREFIDHASASYIDAQTNSTPDLSKLIYLYSLICQMRTLSSQEVIEVARSVVSNIVESYPQGNKSFPELRQMMNEGALDPLRKFSEACRRELQGGREFSPTKR